MNSYQEFRLYEIYDESKEYNCTNIRDLRCVFNTLQPYGIMTMKNRIIFFLILEKNLDEISSKITYPLSRLDFLDCIMVYCKKTIYEINEMIDHQNCQNSQNWLKNIVINEAYKVIDLVEHIKIELK